MQFRLDKEIKFDSSKFNDDDLNLINLVARIGNKPESKDLNIVRNALESSFGIGLQYNPKVINDVKMELEEKESVKLKIY